MPRAIALVHDRARVLVVTGGALRRRHSYARVGIRSARLANGQLALVRRAWAFDVISRDAGAANALVPKGATIIIGIALLPFHGRGIVGALASRHVALIEGAGILVIAVRTRLAATLPGRPDALAVYAGIPKGATIAIVTFNATKGREGATRAHHAGVFGARILVIALRVVANVDALLLHDVAVVKGARNAVVTNPFIHKSVTVVVNAIAHFLRPRIGERVLRPAINAIREEVAIHVLVAGVTYLVPVKIRLVWIDDSRAVVGLIWDAVVIVVRVYAICLPIAVRIHKAFVSETVAVVVKAVALLWLWCLANADLVSIDALGLARAFPILVRDLAGGVFRKVIRDPVAVVVKEVAYFRGGFRGVAL